MSNPKKRGNNRKRVFLDVFSPSENDPGVCFPIKNLFPILENWWTFAVQHCSWFLARSSQVKSTNLSLNACLNSSHTVSTLWCTGWSLLRLSIMLHTHKSTFSPLISMRANATCQIGDSNPATPWLSMRYPRNLVRKALALVLSS